MGSGRVELGDGEVKSKDCGEDDNQASKKALDELYLAIVWRLIGKCLLQCCSKRNCLIKGQDDVAGSITNRKGEAQSRLPVL